MTERILQYLSFVSARMAESADAWREEQKRCGEGLRLPTLIVSAPEIGTQRIRAGEPLVEVRDQAAHDEDNEVSYSFLASGAFEKLLTGAETLQSLQLSKELQITGSAKASIHLSQLFALARHDIR